ncbi:MAG TPA: DUF5677 domain-containing protein [Gammaproteobacteria bacterium]|nr:DUF5677 domain-containing protein [Gammaproteobacteria bacterium]
MTAAYTEVLSFLKTSHDEFQVLAEEIKFNGSDTLHRSCVSLYGSILELTTSFVILTDKGLLTGASVLVRSILEAYVDLENLTRDKSYLRDMEVSFAAEWLKILNEAAHGKNPYLGKLSEVPDLAEAIQKWEKKKAELESQGGRALRHLEKFQKANLENEYRSVYNDLCSKAHNNLRALFDRHSEMGEDDFSITYYKIPEEADNALTVGIVTEILMRATLTLHSYFDSSVLNRVKTRRQELDKLRGD